MVKKTGCSNNGEFQKVKESRTSEEVAINLSVVEDLIWYYDLKSEVGEDYSDLCDDCLEKAKDIEDWYKNDIHQLDKFDYGILIGKALTLHWILGEEWQKIDS